MFRGILVNNDIDMGGNMKIQLIGIAMLLFAILLEMESNGMGTLCTFLGFIGLLVTMAGGIGDSKN